MTVSNSNRGHQRTQLRGEVAASLDLPPRLTPWMDELFAGLSSLGSSPRRVASMLREGGLRPNSRVLDLACGKGATAVELARALRCRVIGVDACESFVQSARELASRRGVAELCEFRVGDVRRPPRGRFDAAMMVGLFGIAEAAPLLRSRVPAGGFYLVDDAFRDDRFKPMPPSMRAIPTRREVEQVISAFGDHVIADDVPSPSRIDRLNRSLYRRLALRCHALAKKEPRLRKLLLEFLSRQRRANVMLRGPLRPGMWLIRRGS